MKLYIILVTAFLFISPLVSQAQNGTKRKATANAGTWVLLASKTVNFNTDSDYVYPSGNDWYSKIYFKVTEAPIQINSVIVHFENGDPFTVSIRGKIQEGGESRVIDLPAGQRKIKKIELSYETLGSNRGRATVAVWARR